MVENRLVNVFLGVRSRALKTNDEKEGQSEGWSMYTEKKENRTKGVATRMERRYIPNIQKGDDRI